MKKKTLDSLDVKTLCYENWKEMSGGGEVRFCSHCEKKVYNLSAMNRADAEKLVETSRGKICVKYAKDSHGKFVTTAPKFTQITRRAAVAAGVLAATLSLSTLAYSHESAEPINNSESSRNQSETQSDELKKSKKTIRKKFGKKTIRKKKKSSSNKRKYFMGILP